MHWHTRAIPLIFIFGCGKPVDTTATGTTSTSTTQTASSTGSTGATGPTTTATTVATDNGGSGTQGQTTSTTSTAGTTTSTTTGTTTGDLCSGEGEPCAGGEACCDPLQCCVGVPVPAGEEFCSDNCPMSDRNAKSDLRAVDVADILTRVVALDITTWHYKKDPTDVRHLGPMAQDFKRAFGLWNTDRMIFPLDATGVSLAAIQGLHRRLVAAEAENDDLRARLDRLERRLAELGPDAAR